jgi:hypothetical protein
LRHGLGQSIRGSECERESREDGASCDHARQSSAPPVLNYGGTTDSRQGDGA